MSNIISLSKKDVDVTLIQSIKVNSKDLNLTINYTNSKVEVLNYLGVEDLLQMDYKYLNTILHKKEALNGR